MVRYAPGVYENLLSQGLINTENSMPINLPNLTGTQMPRGGTPIPEGVQIGSGPVRGGFFNANGNSYTGQNPLLQPNLNTESVQNLINPIRPGVQIPEGGAPRIGGPYIPANPTPITNTGIGSLTENPINTTPESNIMGSMTSSPYLNNNQDLDQYLNSYVENLINRRMRDIFGGIMSIFQ